MTLAIFDLDNTLLAGDSDHSWGEFLIAQGLVDEHQHRAENDRFYEDYKSGSLDILAYQEFVLEFLTHHSSERLTALHQEFMASAIEPLLLPKAQALVDKHRQEGHTLLVITATNDFVTAPIVAHHGIEHLIATTAEQVDGRYTGKVVGTPSFQQGKIERLNEWLKHHPNLSVDGAFFYSDSHNDLPLLELVDNPVAVDPDDTLRAFAEQQQWPIISLR